MRRLLSDIILSIIIFVIGVCLVIWSDMVIKAASILIGSIFIIYGLVLIIRYLKNVPKSIISFASAIVSMIIGAILLMKPNIISESISVIVGVFVIITSIGKLSDSIEYKGINYRVNIGLAITGIVIGILCVVGKILIPNVMLEFMGILLIVFGVINFINTIIIPK